MRFTLKNLGRLEEATIDLSRDLIVLTGPNNTSKTYVAYAIYGFLKTIPGSLAHTLLGPRGFWPAAFSEDHEIDISRLVRQEQRLWLDTAASACSLSDIFASDEQFASKASIIAEVDEAQFQQNEAQLAATEIAHPVSGRRVRVDEQSHSVMLTLPAFVMGSEAAEDHHVWAASAMIRDLIFPSTPHILTAERSAIHLFGRELSMRRTDLVDSLLARTGKAANNRDPLTLLGQRARRYSMPIRDGLREVDDLAVLRKNTSPLAGVADRLGHDVMAGRIQVADDGDMAFHPEGATSGISMSLASSSVKALSSLSFYLRHLAQVGDFLIIDEPELNLHPDNQRRVAKLLVRIARSGVKVMISTHSDYVIREINNAIMLSADEGGDLRRKYGYEEEDTITPDRVGAYLFDQKRAHPIEIKPTGIEVETIEREINSLNASSQDIYFTLFHGRQS